MSHAAVNTLIILFLTVGLPAFLVIAMNLRTEHKRQSFNEIEKMRTDLGFHPSDDIKYFDGVDYDIDRSKIIAFEEIILRDRGFRTSAICVLRHHIDKHVFVIRKTYRYEINNYSIFVPTSRFGLEDYVSQDHRELWCKKLNSSISDDMIGRTPGLCVSNGPFGDVSQGSKNTPIQSMLLMELGITKKSQCPDYLDGVDYNVMDSKLIAYNSVNLTHGICLLAVIEHHDDGHLFLLNAQLSKERSLVSLKLHAPIDRVHFEDYVSKKGHRNFWNETLSDLVQSEKYLGFKMDGPRPNYERVELARQTIKAARLRATEEVDLNIAETKADLTATWDLLDDGDLDEEVKVFDIKRKDIEEKLDELYEKRRTILEEHPFPRWL